MSRHVINSIGQTVPADVPVTVRAVWDSDLAVLPYAPRCGMEVSHTLRLKPMCPRSGNPLPGSSVTITYRPGMVVLEVVALQRFLDSFAAGREFAGERVASMEQVIEATAFACAQVLDVPVTVAADLRINPDQRMTVTAEVAP